MDNLGVRITATSDVAAGVAETKASLGGLEGAAAALNSAFATMGARMREAFTGSAAAANQTTAAVEKTAAAANTAGAAFGRMSERIHLGAMSFGLMEKATAPLMEAMMAVFAVDKIGEFINHMAEGAEKISHLSQQFGMTTGQIQQLQGVAVATGIPIDSLTRGMGLLDRNLMNAAMGSKNTQQALKAVGVSANDGRDQMQKLEAVANRFQSMPDGWRKAALAMQLFGRSGRDLIPILDLGAAGIEALNAKMKEYGVVNDAAQQKGEALAESVNEFHLAMMGVSNVLEEALAPVFKVLVDGLNEMIAAFIKSYETGGAVAIVFQVITGAIEIVVDVIEALWSVCSSVFGAIWSVVADLAGIFTSVFGHAVPSNISVATQVLNVFKDTCVIVADAVKIFVAEVETGFLLVAHSVMMAADVATQALLSVFGHGDVQAAWNRGMSQLVTIVHNGAEQIKKDAASMAAAWKAAQEGKSVAGAGGGIKLPKNLGDGAEYNPQGPQKKPKKPKSDKASEMEIWKQQLADELNMEENWGVDELAFSEAFWQKKLAQVKAGSKEDVEIRRMMAQEKKGIFKEEQQAEIETIKNTETIRLDDAKTQTTLIKNGLNEQLEAINEKEKLGQISGTKAVAQRNQINQQLLQADRQEAEEEYTIKLQALEAELALEHQTKDEKKKIDDQILALKQQFYNQMQTMDAQYTAKVKANNDALVQAYVQKWQGIVQPISSSLDGMFNSLYTRQESFKQAGIKAIDSIVEHWAQKGIEWLANYIATKLGMRAADTAANTQATATQAAADATKLATAQTGNAGEIASNAGVASAAAFASTAAIPVIGPALAPAAAATAYGTVMSMVPLAFAEGGYDIPSGVNPMAQLHQEEMVLPAHLANPLRSMLASPLMAGGDRAAGAGRSAGETGRKTNIDNSRGDTNLHYSPAYPAPPTDVNMDHLLKTEGDRLIKFLKRSQRDGKLG